MKSERSELKSTSDERKVSDSFTVGLFVDAVAEGRKKALITKEYVASRGSFLVYNDAEAIAAIDIHFMSEVYAIVPDVSRYVRDMTKYGPVKMGFLKLRSLGVLELIKLGIRHARDVPRVLKQDMIKALPILVHLDYLELKKVHPTKMFLHYQMTDLALANDNRALVACYLGLAKRYPHCELGLMTKNLTLLEQKLREWDLYAPCVLAPFQSTGYGMRVSQKKCEDLVKTPLRQYVAYTYATAGSKSAEVAYLRKIGIKKAFVCLREE